MEDDGGESTRSVRIKTKDDVLTATVLNPYVEARCGAAIAQDIRDAVGRTGRKLRALVLDVSYVDFINSSGLGQLADLATKIGEGVACIVFGASEELARTLRLVRLDRLYTIVGGAAELKRKLAGE